MTLSDETFGRLVAPVVTALGATWRVRVAGEEHVRRAREIGPGPVIFAFWHGRFFPLCSTHRARGICVLASEHRDGGRVAAVVGRMGYSSVRGSSETGGWRAARRLIRAVREGADVAIPVDGPRGPRGVAKPGPALVARATGAPIVPVTTDARPRWTVRSWDRFLVPPPLARVHVIYGAPVVVDGEGAEGIRRATERLERALHALTDGAGAAAR